MPRHIVIFSFVVFYFYLYIFLYFFPLCFHPVIPSFPSLVLDSSFYRLFLACFFFFRFFLFSIIPLHIRVSCS